MIVSSWRQDYIQIAMSKWQKRSGMWSAAEAFRRGWTLCVMQSTFDDQRCAPVNHDDRHITAWTYHHLHLSWASVLLFTHNKMLFRSKFQDQLIDFGPPIMICHVEYTVRQLFYHFELYVSYAVQCQRKFTSCVSSSDFKNLLLRHWMPLIAVKY